MAYCPEYHTELIDVTCSVDEKLGYGKTYLLRTCSGLPDGLIRECVAEFSWEKKDEDWFCSKYRALRCFPWHDSETLGGLNSGIRESES